MAQRSLAPDARVVMEGKGKGGKEGEGGKEESMWRESRREEVAVRTVRVGKGETIVL